MKGQEIGLLLKLICLQKQEQTLCASIKDKQDFIRHQYTIRELADSTGISKSQVSLALQNCFENGLAKRDRKLTIPRVNRKELTEFIVYGLKYVFPVKLGVVTRGMPTSFAAPILKNKLLTTGELVPVWSDAEGNLKGQSVTPLFKSVVYAAKKDAQLYHLLALTDAIRLGLPRERNLAIELLRAAMEKNDK